jgi:hypothetical protein
MGDFVVSKILVFFCSYEVSRAANEHSNNRADWTSCSQDKRACVRRLRLVLPKMLPVESIVDVVVRFARSRHVISDRARCKTRQRKCTVKTLKRSVQVPRREKRRRNVELLREEIECASHQQLEEN